VKVSLHIQGISRLSSISQKRLVMSYDRHVEVSGHIGCISAACDLVRA
jgi:hypothetical protein